jgi:hypothetical protein
VALTPAGHVLVGSPGALLIELDSTGQVLRTFLSADGRPDAYSLIAATSADRAGNVWAFDIRRWRWLRFDPNGRLAHTEPVPLLPLLHGFRARNDLLFLHAIPPGSTVGSQVMSEFYVLDHGGTLKVFAHAPARAVQTTASHLRPIPPPFAAMPVWDVGPKGDVLYSTGAEYVVMRFSAAGPPSIVIEAAGVQSRAVTAHDLDLEATRIGLGGTRLEATADRARRSAMDAASTRHPAITALRCLGDSTILVRRVPDEASDSVRWDLLTWSGELWGHVFLGAADQVVDGSRTRFLVATSIGAHRRIAWLRLRV